METLIPRGRRARPGVVIWTYLYVWLMVGFFSGTLVLLGPAGWLSGALQRSGWEERSRNLALMALIAAWVVATVFVSIWLVRRVFRTRRRGLRLAIPLAVTLLAGAALVEWMNPARMLAHVAGGTASRMQTESGAEFIFGPYPDRARLAALKAEGVDAVVSLQHPAVPVEVPGIREERRAAAELGMEFIHAPMLPWISDNQASLNTIRTLVQEGRGRYYVHCGLGRDRVTVVRRLVQSMGGRQAATRGEVKTALTFADRRAQAAAGEVPSADFERGPLTEVERGVWLVPHPNRSELFGYMLAGQVAHVVSVLDPADTEQREWIEEQRRAFQAFSVPVTFLPLAAGDTVRAREIVQEIRRLPHPVAVVAPRTPRNGYEDAAGMEKVAAVLHRAFRTAPAAPAAPARAASE